MADNLETMGNFSIQDTMEMGMGNQELLQDLFSPETSTSNPEDVTAIIKDADAPAAPSAPSAPSDKCNLLLPYNMLNEEETKLKYYKFLTLDVIMYL